MRGPCGPFNLRFINKTLMFYFKEGVIKGLSSLTSKEADPKQEDDGDALIIEKMSWQIAS